MRRQGIAVLEVQIAVAKTHKYASRESGDTVEVVERPHGGLSVLLVDAQGSGPAAKTLSNLIVSRGVSLIKEGARDGAVARAVHGYLYTLRGGRVSAALTIASVDLQSRSLLVSRNDACPACFFSRDGIEVHDEPAEPIGVRLRIRPVIVERPLKEYLGVVVMSDGVVQAGAYRGRPFDVPAFLASHLAEGWPAASALADALLGRAMALEEGRPHDDATVVVVAIVPALEEENPVRRLAARLPIETTSRGLSA
ncbi:MAG: SpoIIE family protein phosphatase [Chloroflexia bacterium]